MKRWKLLAVILTAMLLMQIGLAMRHSLWADEVFSLAMATGHSMEHPAAKAQPVLGDFVERDRVVTAAELRRYTEFGEPVAGPGRVLRAVMLSDTSPPLYYLLLHVWARIWGVSDMALRMFSILLSLGCVPLIIAVGREAEAEKAGWIAAVLFAMAPMSLYYSSEGRMYSLLWFCVLASTYATVKLYRGASEWRWQILWVSAGAAGFLVHYYFVFPWAATGLFLLCCPGADRRLRLVGRVAAVAVLILPWYLKFTDTLAQWRITSHWMEIKPSGYVRPLVARDLLVQYFSGYGRYIWQPHRIAELGVLIVFTVAGCIALWRWRARFFAGPRLLLWMWFLAAGFGPLVADIVRGTYLASYPRYSSAALPAACLIGGMILSSVRESVAWLGVFLIGLGWAPSVMSIYRGRSRSSEPMADIARHVSAYGRADDLILVHSIPTGAIGLARYTTSPAAFATWVGQLGQRKVPESLVTLLKDRARVVFVKVHAVGEPAPEEVWLRENAIVVKEKRLAEAYITEFRPRNAEHF